MTRPPARFTSRIGLPAGRAGIHVGKGTKWANPFVPHSKQALARVPAAVGDGDWEYEGRSTSPGNFHPYYLPDGTVVGCTVRYMTADEAIDTFRRALTGDLTPGMLAASPNNRFLTYSVDDVRRELAGKNLICGCRAGTPCHADVLLEIANTTGGTDTDGATGRAAS